MWKRNAAVIGVGIALGSIYILSKSFAYERRYNAGPIPVPSQRMAAHTTEDDPKYYEKLKEWKKNKRSIFERIFQTKEDFNEE